MTEKIICKKMIEEAIENLSKTKPGFYILKAETILTTAKKILTFNTIKFSQSKRQQPLSITELEKIRSESMLKPSGYYKYQNLTTIIKINFDIRKKKYCVDCENCKEYFSIRKLRNFKRYYSKDFEEAETIWKQEIKKELQEVYII